ncbi:MAG: 6,7-dimethyl-8-ribityllumazine synthase [Chitinophagaceae bacterium]|nr:6,7-dimethyl-8-ribityllumazine synthase [Chitinophagaceae bacterium]
MAEIKNSNVHDLPEGIHKIKNAFVILVRTQWNTAIVDEMERRCVEVLQQHKIKTKTLIVPGAVEIPFAIHQCWNTTKKKTQPAAFIALGCVVRGDTPHFEYVCQSVTTGVSNLNILLPVPVIFGVLTVNYMQQAEDRIGGQHGHKGEEAAISAMKMILLNQQFGKE